YVELLSGQPRAGLPGRCLEGRPFLGHEPRHGHGGAVTQEAQHDRLAERARAPGDHRNLSRHPRRAAAAFMWVARSKSRAVIPPASWVDRSTVTRFQTLDHSG